MKTEHTPGPWCVMSTGNHQGLVVAENSPENIAVVYDKKDADIVAAAPDLLEACQYVVDWHREHDSGEGESFGLDFVTTCIGAIEKAKGGGDI